jgi:uncharacterized protein (TIGR02246 family)
MSATEGNPICTEAGRIEMRNWMTALVVLTLAVGLAPAAGAQDSEEMAVQAVATSWAEAWNAGDMDAIGALYAEASDYVNFFGETVTGRSAIQAAFAEINSTVYKGTKISIEPAALTFIKPDVAVSDTTWEITGLPAGAPKVPTAGQSTAVMVKQDGGWKIVAHRSRVPQQPGQ